MSSFSRQVYGYHGCDQSLADALISGTLAIKDWPRSQNEYDWLGHGIYFWEYGPQRAREWSLENGRDGGVVGVHLHLGRCLDLTDTQYTGLLAATYRSVKESLTLKGISIPVNSRKRNNLDCLVINEAIDSKTDFRFQTVRCPFLEGAPAFEGSMIQLQSHIQISVIDTDCILGVFRPNL